jgi:nitroimidazol reductase NimA-like FMN-containing flavoprotein (pyridoxamine 5'-phosphate oxidase superfamily)
MASDEPVSASKRLEITERSRVRRRAMRGDYDRATVDAILDEGLVAHVGVVHEGGPVVIPTAYGRAGAELVLHGAMRNRVFASMAAGAEACVEVTLLDGLVLARSAFHHSVNYRAVVIYGRARVVEGTAEKIEALHTVVEHVVPGRWADVRQPNDEELAATLVLALPITEASAKVRAGPPVDDEQDYALAAWAGVIPLRMLPGDAIADDRLAAGTRLPPYAAAYARPTRG